MITQMQMMPGVITAVQEAVCFVLSITSGLGASSVDEHAARSEAR